VKYVVSGTFLADGKEISTEKINFIKQKNKRGLIPKFINVHSKI